MSLSAHISLLEVFKNITKNIKLYIYQTIIRSILVYGAEVWQIPTREIYRDGKNKKWKHKGNNGSEREAGHHRYHRAEKIKMVWPRQKDAIGENTKINCELDTAGEKEKRTSKKTWMEGVQAAMTTSNLEPDQWRNREEWRLVSGRPDR